MELAPTSGYVLFNLGTLRLLQGNAQESLDMFRKVDLDSFGLTGIAMAEHTLGHTQESLKALEGLRKKHAEDSAYQVAQVFAWRGEKDQAFEWLERAYERQDGGLSVVKTDPTLRSLHADPRFKILLRKMNLPE
jgi:serine/threonine-protein kinase